MNKYIKEKGIIKLIEKYCKMTLDEVFNILRTANDIMYHVVNTTDCYSGTLFVDLPVKINFIVDDSFIIFEEMHDDGVIMSQEYCYGSVIIHKIKFSKNKNFYLEMLKDSIYLSDNEFIKKYEKILKKAEIKIIGHFGMHKLLLSEFNVEYYNIKICCLFDIDNKEKQKFDIKFNSEREKNICFEDVYSKEINITMNTNMSINIHNLKIS
jgi:hypothetical protein